MPPQVSIGSPFVKKVQFSFFSILRFCLTLRFSELQNRLAGFFLGKNEQLLRYRHAEKRIFGKEYSKNQLTIVKVSWLPPERFREERTFYILLLVR